MKKVKQICAICSAPKRGNSGLIWHPNIFNVLPRQYWDNEIFDIEDQHELINYMLLNGAYLRKSRLIPFDIPTGGLYSRVLWYESGGAYGDVMIFSFRISGTGYIRYIMPLWEETYEE